MSQTQDLYGYFRSAMSVSTRYAEPSACPVGSIPVRSVRLLNYLPQWFRLRVDRDVL